MRRKLKYKGLLFPIGFEATGHVELCDKNISVNLVGDLYKIMRENVFDIQGTLSDGKKISMLECINNKGIIFHDREKRSVEMDLYTHIVVVGSELISSVDKRVLKITYECEDAHILCEYKKTFGLLHPSSDEMDVLIEADQEKTKKIIPDWEPPQKEEAGEYPVIGYFDGNHEIANADYSCGKISIWNGLSYNMGSARGVNIKNTVRHTIEFGSLKTVREALSELQNMHRFYELLIGRRQKFKSIELVLEGMAENEIPPLKLIWNGCNKRVNRKKDRKTIPSDIPILASVDRKNFEKSLSGWMGSSSSMAESRARLFNGILKGLYSYDRIIGAANMYDLLPEEKVPKTDDLPHDLAQMVIDTKKTFKSLGQSSARDSVLSTLGRIGKPSLKSKILCRGTLVNNALGSKFKNLEMVCHQAVICRNHYVHGSPAGFDYESNFSSYAFLTETLEFIFAAADLLDCGWEPAEYMSRHGTMSHFFGRYIYNYEGHLHELEKTLNI